MVDKVDRHVSRFAMGVLMFVILVLVSTIILVASRHPMAILSAITSVLVIYGLGWLFDEIIGIRL